MLEETHARIAVAIAEKLGMRREETSLFEEGSIRPDSYIEFPHHKNKESQLLGNILDSRALYLNNDNEAFIKLGEACHFIADKWTLKPRNEFKHVQYETSIEASIFQDDNQFSKEIKQSTIPTKSKVYYEKLCNAARELVSCSDFTFKKTLLTNLVENDPKNLQRNQSSFLSTYCDWVMFALQFVYTLPTGISFDDFLPPKDFIPFPMIAHIAWVTREKTDAEKYSNPTIDLNISLRLCSAASYFVLSKKGIRLPQQILDWDDLPLNWNELIKKNIADKIKQKEAQKKPI